MIMTVKLLMKLVVHAPTRKRIALAILSMLTGEKIAIPFKYWDFTEVFIFL